MAPAAEKATSSKQSVSSTSPEPNAEELYGLGCAAMLCESYDEAAELFSKALYIRVKLHGEMALENAQTFYKYGCALLKKAQAESEVVVERGKGEDSDNVEELEDEEHSGMAEEEETDEEEDHGDLELAGRVLECARAIYANEAKRTLAEVDVITTLAEVRLEEEAFLACFDDYSVALSMLENLVEADDRRLAELCFKISVAKLLAVEPQEALEYCNRAISVSELILQRLNRELSTEQYAGGGHVEVPSKRTVESVSDGVDLVAQVKYSEHCKLRAGYKEKVEDGGKLVGSDNLADSGGGGVEAKSKSPKQPSQAALKAEVKELEELLIDLRERVLELQLMETHPSLRALQSLDDVLSRNRDGTTKAGSFSKAPVADLRVLGRDVKRVTLTPIVDEHSSDVQQERASKDAFQGGSSGKTQIRFNGP